MYWNRLNAMQRLHFVLQHKKEFLNFHLVSPSELKIADRLPESAREYILHREELPIFNSLNIKAEIQTQACEERLVIALKAIFN